MAVKEGKKFEENFQSSAENVDEKIFFTRIKDTFIPPDLRQRVKVTKNDYDCMMFARSHLFTLELKSTKENRFSFDESIIKQHQIDKLVEANTYEGVISGFVMNFREPQNRVFFVPIQEFVKYQYIAQNQIKENKYKVKINKSSIPIGICEEIGIEIKGFKKKVNWHYHIKEFITEAINSLPQTV
ncbi:Holliday junction resolvase RecU [Paenibacillus sp. FSL E2-0178]|uniref:Holliday junction resolvase RecU n=1 Tax=Paenibacillus sp. FSL E2-0178 TaxID=2921361 RepID=UPI003158EA04